MATMHVTTTGGADSALDETTIRALQANLRGPLFQRGDPGYETARSVWNGMIDKQPALIARCAGVADVIQAVNFARAHHLLLAVRGGGHNVNGSATCDGGLVIDLSLMKGIHVDPQARTARAQPGVTWGELDREAQLFGLAAPGGVISTTGIAGLTLGGGLGWLRRKHGLSCDNLRSVDVVTADGRLLTASETDNADLFWAVRGGGGNFGVVTSFEYQLHPVGPEVMWCFVFYPAAIAKDALRFYREYAATAPDELSSFAVFGTVLENPALPPATYGAPYLLFVACYAGPVEAGARVIQPLRRFSTPLADLSAPMPYPTVQSFLDADYPAGKLRYYWKSRYLDELSDAAIDVLAELAAARPSPRSTLDIWQLGGAFSRIDTGATAFGRRDAPFLLGIEANWERAQEDEQNVAWTRQVYARVEPFSSGGSYLNLHVLGDAQERAGYSPNHERLVAVKTRYDPTNLFRLNQNIQPAMAGSPS